MWTTIINILLQVIINIISDKKVMEVAKKLIKRAVDSKDESVGVTEGDVQEIFESVAKSTLNSFTNKEPR